MSDILNIVLLGLENAGKTTLLNTLKGEQFRDTSTTIGINVDLINYNGYKFQAIDVGGQRVFRDTLWPQYTKLASGVIFIFDIFDKGKLSEAKKWFDEIQTWVTKKAVFLFLANKIDLKEERKDFMSLDDVIKSFNLERFSLYPEQSFRIFEVSAKTGENVDVAIKWLFEKLSEQVRKQTNLSFIFVHNSDFELIYVNSEKVKVLEKLLLKHVSQLRKNNMKTSFLNVDEYKLFFYVEPQFSIIFGAKNIYKQFFLNVALEIANELKTNHLPLTEYKPELDGIISRILIKEK
ncbi:MAG: GTP-binding protein [Candidatus Heimdallarchaeum aukensis]|uniref:GTP-binding protein n=1 Tax=Candidatus Heimdallarchaeum aukensis TaxID=2876573 RepID=A0A9Y1BKP9_9ARCH|nr:MAG: GTP-binding protein [Candidatus Heimdallarchaeum aukensis]